MSGYPTYQELRLIPLISMPASRKLTKTIDLVSDLYRSDQFELGKTLDRHLFVGVHLKGFVQLSHLHHAMYVFGRIQKL